MKRKSILYFTLLFTLSLFAFGTKSYANEKISVDIDTGKAYKGKKYVPQIAVWVEDESGKFIETLYITKKEGKGKYWGAKTRKEALPVWKNKSNHKLSKSDLDGISGASAKKSFQIMRNINNYPEKFSIYLEVNKSYDYNSYYKKKSKQSDPGHNTGYSGQPSIIYKAMFTKTENGKYAKTLQKMKVIGHGSPTGKNGKIDYDISHLTSALQILDEVTVKIK